MSLTNDERLRQLLGEVIPPDGTSDDTMFSEEEITDFLDRAYADVDAAAYYGWQAKMSQLANLVNVTEGNASREMGELHKNAKRMVDQFAGHAPTSGRGRARIGSISRSRRR